MRGTRVTVICAIASVLSALIVARAGADDAAIGGSGMTAYALENREVEMAAERVIIDSGRVQCEFALWNTSNRPTRVQVGFPEAVSEGGDSDAALHDFDAWVDGRRVSVVIKAGAEGPGRGGAPAGLPPGIRIARWYTWWMDFKPHQTRVVSHHYWIVPSDSTAGNWSYNYVLRTGGTWKGGQIGEVHIWFRAGRSGSWDRVGFPFSPEMLLQPQADFLGKEARKLGLVSIKPEGFEIGKGWVHWHWRNLKPRADVLVRYAGRTHPKGKVSARSLPALIEKRFPRTHFAGLARIQAVRDDAIVTGNTGAGWAQKCIAEYERDFPDGYGLDVLLLTVGAALAMHRQEPSVPLGLLARLIRDFPQSAYAAVAHYWSADVLYHQGRYADAIAHVKAALASPPESAMTSGEKHRTLILAADCYEQMGDKREADYYRSLSQLADWRRDFVPWVGGG